MATDFKSPLGGILDYLVPDSLEKEVITGFATDRDRSYGDFKPKISTDNPQGLSNIETLLGYATAPQFFKAPTNRQMIDASILRAGLELMKPNQPGENTASALLRSLDQAGQPAKTLATAQAAAAKARGSRPSQVSLPEFKLIAFEDVGNSLIGTNAEFTKIVDELSGGWFDSLTTQELIRSIASNAGSIQSADPNKSNLVATLESARQIYASRNLGENAEKIIPVVDDSNNRPNIPNIKIK